MTDDNDPIREGLGCVLQALAVAILLVGWALANYIELASR